VIDTLAVVDLGQATVNFRQEHQALDGILDRRVCRQLLDGREHSPFGGLGSGL